MSIRNTLKDLTALGLPGNGPAFNAQLMTGDAANRLTTNKTIVILGSSNAAGVGASTYTADPSVSNGWASPSTSWAGLLATALGTSWTVLNFSVTSSGFGTTNGTATSSVSRFWSQVAPVKPAYVILCNNPENDGYQSGVILPALQKLISWCDQIGAIPIVRGFTPNDAISADQYNEMLNLNRQIEALGCHTIDNLSELDNGSGGFLGADPGVWTGDGNHPTDLGHYHYFTNIDQGLFTAFAPRRRNQIQHVGVWSAPTTSGVGPAIHLQGLAMGLYSFTARMRVLGTTSAQSAAAYITAKRTSTVSTNDLRIRNPSSFYDLASFGSDLGASTIASNTAAWHDLVLVYNNATNTATMYIDGGASPGNGQTISATNPDTSTTAFFTDIYFGSREDTGAGSGIANCSIADLAVWCVPLSAAQVRRLYAGQVPVGSLVFYADLSGDPPALPSVPNQASGLILPTIPNQVLNGTRGAAPQTMQFTRLYGQG